MQSYVLYNLISSSKVFIIILGLSVDALCQAPSNPELLRFSVNCTKRMIHDLALHLGMEEIEWCDMEDNYPENAQIVKFLTLVNLKENYSAKFADLEKGLRKLEITTHKLCMVSY